MSLLRFGASTGSATAAFQSFRCFGRLSNRRVGNRGVAVTELVEVTVSPFKYNYFASIFTAMSQYSIIIYRKSEIFLAESRILK